MKGLNELVRNTGTELENPLRRGWLSHRVEGSPS